MCGGVRHADSLELRCGRRNAPGACTTGSSARRQQPTRNWAPRGSPATTAGGPSTPTCEVRGHEGLEDLHLGDGARVHGVGLVEEGHAGIVLLLHVGQARHGVVGVGLPLGVLGHLQFGGGTLQLAGRAEGLRLHLGHPLGHPGDLGVLGVNKVLELLVLRDEGRDLLLAGFEVVLGLGGGALDLLD